MRFSQFITELAQNEKTYTDVLKRLGSSALVGVELEMVVKADSPLMDKSAVKPTASLPLKNFRDYAQFNDYFIISPMQKKEIKRLVKEFQQAAEDEWVDAHWRKFADRSGNVSAQEFKARKAAALQYYSDEDPPTFQAWLNATHDGPLGFIEHYDLEPKNGWDGADRVFVDEPHSNAQFVAAASGVKRQLDKLLSTDIDISTEYHGAPKGKRWVIEPDTSIESDDGQGIELVSPPMPLSDAVKQVEAILKWMTEAGIETNATTGIHINVSIPNMAEKLDPVKLVLFSGEEHLLSIFDRVGNKFAAPQVQLILQSVKRNGVPSADAVKEMIKLAKAALSDDRYTAINFGHLADGYIEARMAGGKDYHKDAAKLRKLIYRLVSAIDVASSPEAERKEYLKKLTAIFDRATGEMQNKPRWPGRNMPEELVRLAKFNQAMYAAWDQVRQHRATGGDDARRRVLVLIDTCLDTAKKYKTELKLSEKVFLKRLMKELTMQSSDVDNYFLSDPRGRLAFKEEFGL